MSTRGFTLLEVIVAAAVLAVVMVSLGSFYLSTVRFANQDSAQVSLQRQASFIIDELARQIAPATLLEYPVSCGGDPNGLRATNTCGTFCFHRDTATLTQIREERTLNGTCPNQAASAGTMDLLSGALIPAQGAAALLSTVNTACGANNGGFCPSLIRHNGTNCVIGAAVTFRLRAQLPESPSYQVMTFSTSIAGRPLPVPIPPATTCP